MLISSLVFALAASGLASPFPNPIHLHPRVKVQDDRVLLKLVNDSDGFRDVKIAGQTYTVERHQALNVKAPAGTMIYSESSGRTHHRGDVLLEVTPAQNNTRITLD